MTSSNGNIFRVTGHLCGEFTGPRWIPRTKASDVELRCFLWSAPWINGWVNNREAGDLRRYRAHYDVIVMSSVAAIYGKSTSFLGPVLIPVRRLIIKSHKEPTRLGVTPFLWNLLSCSQGAYNVWTLYENFKYGSRSLLAYDKTSYATLKYPPLKTADSTENRALENVMRHGIIMLCCITMEQLTFLY